MSQRPADNYVRMEAKQQIIITSTTVDSLESEYFPNKRYTNKKKRGYNKNKCMRVKF